MRAGTDAQIVAKAPVVQVVAAAVPRQREGRHLVARETGLLHRAQHDVLQLGSRVVIGQAGWGLGGKQGVGLKTQVIAGQVGRVEGQRLLQILP